MGELIDLDAERKKAWIRKIEHMRSIGGVAVFGSIGEQNAQILPFKHRKQNDGERVQEIERDN